MSPPLPEPLGRLRTVIVGVAVAAALLAAGGCGQDGGGRPSAGKPSRVPQDQGGPLRALDRCQDPPKEAENAEVPGLVLPEGSVVTGVRRKDPLVMVEAYVGKTPVLVRRFYQRHPGLEISEIEDEVFEAEVLFADGKSHRSYVKAEATCRTGSNLSVVVAPEVAGGQLPKPEGD